MKIRLSALALAAFLLPAFLPQTRAQAPTAAPAPVEDRRRLQCAL